MKVHIMPVRQVGKGTYLIKAIESAQLGRLTDADGTGLRVVLEAETMEPRGDQLRGELAVRGIDSEQPASHNALWRTTFVDVDMGRLGAHHGVVRTTHKVEGEHIGARTVENEIDTGGRTKMVTEERLGTTAPSIIAIGKGMVAIGSSKSLHNLTTHARMIITTKTSHSNIYYTSLDLDKMISFYLSIV